MKIFVDARTTVLKYSYVQFIRDKIEWTGNGNRCELNLVKVALLLRT